VEEEAKKEQVPRKLFSENSENFLGIGLALVQKLTNLQGGTIQVYSKLGKGTLVLLRFQLGNDVMASKI
jgi:signal transduction histidine kinase